MATSFAPPVDQPRNDETRGAVGPPPRKRRRRAAAGGANDDCFACCKRSVACDRKRPYCTQCIDIGKECSGYKTTLTWGVGVASRGKLRGLSCPIANKNVDGTDVVPADAESSKRKRKSSVSQVKKEETSPTDAGPSYIPQGLPFSNAERRPTLQMSMPPPSMPIHAASVQNSWQVPNYQERILPRVQDVHPNMAYTMPQSQQHHPTPDLPLLNTVITPQDHQSMASYTEPEFHTPREYPGSPGATSYIDHIPHSAFSNDQPNSAHSTTGFNTMLNSSLQQYHDLSASNMGYASNQNRSSESGTNLNHAPTQLSPLDGMIFGNNDLSFEDFDTYQQDTHEEETQALSTIDSRFSEPFFHLSPRLQTLLNYYDQNICPYLVTFDGPENPYRKHILQLAFSNEGLQNAIAALATNNWRMRRKEVRSVGFVEELTDAFDGSSDKELNEATPEESAYKQMSIDQLNMQLTSRSAAQDDSVLATLLILCLFHVCDSGFSKFKTQLAGVQKLLSLRNPEIQSTFTHWVEMFFIWFDVMTSTVNDREMQIKGESLDMLDFSANLGALEQFSGCDGKLFKLIARLGRLNLLAQGRPVKSDSGLPATARAFRSSMPSAPRRRHQAFNRKHRSNRTLTLADYENIDGNGWGTPIHESDEDAELSTEEGFTTPDERQTFWREWHDIRTRLQAWQMDVTPPTTSILPDDPNDPFTLLHKQQQSQRQRDLEHINESFRYSAILYTERLGHPLLPSSHSQFQTLVARALFHITALPTTSCVNKFLLWPLFITGTECVDEGHRNIIRTRCVEVQRESGFFNNISSLDLLEKVWREAGSNVQGQEGDEVRARRRDSEVGRAAGRYGQAFRWRKAMDRVDGEYIVI